MSKRVFNEKEIEHARDMDMLSYLESKGETFTQTGNYYKHNEHDSLVICPSKGYYVWNSHGGRERADRSCIDLAMAFFNLNFSEAVTDILEHSNVKKIDRSRESVHRDFSYEREIKESHDTTSLKQYLSGERKINTWLVSELIEKGYIAQDVHRNVVFKWFDPVSKKSIVGASKEGTQILPIEKRIHPNRKRFKQIISTGNHGFYFDIGKTASIDKIYFFESSIDAMSYLTLKIDQGSQDIHNARFLSMEGLKVVTLIENYKLLENKLGHEIEAHVCVDNDMAGHQFFHSLENYNFIRNGKPMLKNDIPYDLVIPKTAYQLFKKTAEEKGIDWTWVAAFQKVETNFSKSGKNASEENFHMFFDEREQLSEEQAAFMCAEMIENHTELNGQVNIRSIIRRQFPETKDFTTVVQLEKKLSYYHEKYEGNWFQVSERIPKDWNDVLVEKHIQKNDFMIEPRNIMSDEESFSDRRIRAARIEYLEGH